MKKIINLIPACVGVPARLITSFLLLTSLSFAFPNNNIPQHLSVNVDFNIKYNNAALNPYHIKRNLRIATFKRGWTVIENDQTKNNQAYVLLGNIEKADKNQVTLRFLVVDPTDKGKIISRPKLVLSYGKKGELEVSDREDILKFSITANRA